MGVRSLKAAVDLIPNELFGIGAPSLKWFVNHSQATPIPLRWYYRMMGAVEVNRMLVSLRKSMEWNCAVVFLRSSSSRIVNRHSSFKRDHLFRSRTLNLMPFLLTPPTAFAIRARCNSS
jgi:RNase adaptor protein for sRNA GlmZ degradation